MNNNLIFLIGLGIGLGVAAGLRPFLPALLAGALGSGHALGLVFSHDYAFLQSGWWLILAAVVLVGAYAAQLRLGPDWLDSGNAGAALSGLAVGVGAVLFAGVLTGHGRISWPGLAGGAAAALVAQVAVRPLVLRVRARLPDRSSKQALTLYLDLGSIVVAGLSALFHPLGYVAAALLIWFALAGRKRTSGKYAGLRVLGR